MGFFHQILSFLSTKRLEFKKNTLSVRHYLDLLKFIKINDDHLTKEVFIDDSAIKKSAEFLSRQRIAPSDVVVGLCLSAGNKIKEWGELNFAKLADEINRQYGFKIIVIGNLSDELLLKRFKQLTGEGVIITYGEFSLKEVPALIKRFNYFISSDTGPLYIANALGVPVLDILGPCNSLDQPPIYERCRVVHVKDLECWPCSSVIKTITNCRSGDLRCLKRISPELVLRSFGELVEEYKINILL